MGALERKTALRISRAAAAELERAMREMRIPGHPRPFYMSYLIRDEESFRLQAKYGAMKTDSYHRGRNAYVDVRVGSYSSDQLRDGGLNDNDKDDESYGYIDLPYGEALDGLRHGLWRLSDARYREALDALLDKRSHELTYVDPNRHLKAFQKCEGVVANKWRDFPQVDSDYWTDYVCRVSAGLRKYKEIRNSTVEFQADHCCRVFVNSEGSRIIQCETIWAVECYLWLLAKDGGAFQWTVRKMVADPDELPDRNTFQREIREAVQILNRLAKAPTVRAFSGPALLDPVPAGLLMHEALGHRLEGNRLLATGEGQTFKDSKGERILPVTLSIRDDPRLTRLHGQSLVGHYLYDDEGVPAENANLVSDGKLVGFLGSRTATRRGHRSNGHARNAYYQRPISRMGTLIVESNNGLDDAGLKQVLLDEIARQQAPFGIRILDATSGETSTDAYNFQAFLGEVNLATKVYPDGREELIRGVNFVGTPLNAIRNIIAAGNRYVVDNAYCGAESGDVPVSTVSPGLVISELELQSKPDAPYTQYSYPAP